jgi:iron(III) transport system substrate-binding protein
MDLPASRRLRCVRTDSSDGAIASLASAGLPRLLKYAAVVMLATAQPSFAQTSDQNESLDALVKAAKAEGSVMIYHTVNVQTIRRALAEFGKKYEIKVRNFYATGTPLSVRFASEVASGIMQADVFYSSDTSIFHEYPNNFQKLSMETMPGYAQLPDTLKMPSGLAVSSVQLSYTMFYNTKRVTDAERPRTWQDLADPKWKGRTLMIEPRSSISFRAPYNVIRTLQPGILSKLADNQPRISESGTSTVQQLAAGTGSIGFAGYPVHAVSLMAKGAPVRWAAIEEPMIARRTWVGAVRGPNPNAARLLVHFLASVDGLRAYCSTDDGSMAALDPSGAKTGCQRLSPDALFLSEEPMSDADSAETLRQLRLQ